MIQKCSESRNTQSPVCYHGIDIIKFCCAFLVVAIHIAPFHDAFFGNADTLNFLFTKAICRIAVPFYFTASGFLLFRGMDLRHIDFKRIEKYCFKLLRLYGLWSVLLLVGGKDHLWYLGATVVAVVCVGLCLRWHWNATLIAMAALVLYGVGLIGDSYYWFLNPFRSIALVDYLIKGYEYFFHKTRNGLFMGFPFVLIGVWFAQKQVKIRTGFASVGFVCSMVLLVLEACFLENRGVCKDYNMYLMLIPADFFLFALAVSVDLKGKAGYKKLRVVGVLVYYMHMMVSLTLELIFILTGKYTGMELHPFKFPATVVLTWLAAVLIYHLSQHKKLLWLQYLYR